MKTVILLFLIFCSASGTDDFRNQAVTVSAGLPGLILPELGYEYAFDPSNRLGLALGTIWLVPEARVSYIRIENVLELEASFGAVGKLTDDDFGILATDDPLVFVSGTAGYRRQSSGGFIFRIAAGGALFMWDGDDAAVPFGQIGLGYGF